MEEIDFDVYDAFSSNKKNPKDSAYSVTQLNRAAKTLLESKFSSVWVEAEISNLKRHTSGHIYLSLKDEQSQISAVFFSRYNQSTRFELKDGLKVLAMGKISLYEQRGQYQFYIERLEPKGMGSLQLAFIQLKEKLEKEGLFSKQHKKAIPRFPKTVGIVTSPTGAAIRDIMNVMARRFSSVNILLSPVRVQGDGSALEIAQGIRDMNECGGVDVLIVGRGGGSLEDLWAFNEEVVARAVYASKIPVISAVGHEIDWTICDLVADLRAPTPSAAAELVVQSGEELSRRLQDFKSRMRNGILNFLDEKRDELLSYQESHAFRQPGALIEQNSQRVDELFRQLGNYLKALLNHQKQNFQNLSGKLNALSPLAILDRGYSLAFDGKKLIKDARQVKVGDELKIRLSRGVIHSRVSKIESSEEE